MGGGVLLKSLAELRRADQKAPRRQPKMSPKLRLPLQACPTWGRARPYVLSTGPEAVSVRIL